MAESFVASIAENVLEKVAFLLRDEVTLACGFETDLKTLEGLLTTVNALLLQVEEHKAFSEKKGANSNAGNWLMRLKNFCYDVEDVLDVLEYEGLRAKVLKQHGSIKMKVRHFFSSSNLSVVFGQKVKELRERLVKIADHGFSSWLSKCIDGPDFLLQTPNVIGRDVDKARILEFLLHSKEDETISVIPIVGLGGMGKTTLAKILYKDESVKKHFDVKIWVHVSKTFEKKQIAKRMIEWLARQDHIVLDPNQLQQMIQEKLNSKRFLLILDDVQSHDRKKWIEFLELLEGGAIGSKVIVTTRDLSVVDIVRTVPSYNLEGLSHEHCLSLFKKLAFREREEESHPHLMEIGDDIVKKCEGIPLAVETMGALLYSKSSDYYWKFIRDHVELKEDDFSPVLKLNYEQLPSHLKRCFAICSIYPKDYDIDNVGLSRIWMANGLLQSSNEQRDMEDIGAQYINELYSRSFLQKFLEDGDVILFKMHDFVHDLALSISQSECFVVDTPTYNIPNGIRYLAFIEKDSLDQEVLSFLQEKNSLRTIIFPRGMGWFLKESFIDTWISSSEYLRMLDLIESPLEVLPSSIGGLKLLRSLNLSWNRRIKRLPNSIWKLHNLLFLYLGGCSELEELSKDINNLIKLRVLEITVKQKRLPDDGIGCLRYLRFLAIMDCSNLEYLFEDIGRLTSLCSLKVLGCGKLISLPRTLMCLNALEYLRIGSCNQFNWTEEDDIQDIKLCLRSLELDKLLQVVTLPRWLHKSSSTLQRLQVCYCENFSTFPEWVQDFTSLEEIVIEGCPKLVSLPEWMPRLTSLKKLRIGECPMLSKRCERLEGEDWQNIAHVPNIKIDGYAYVDTGTSSTV